MKKDFIRAFTLAETMIVLVVLGVIAVVTVPALVNKHIESANRTKVKKAMTVYDTALNKMVIENGIKDNAALYESANSFAPENDCTNTAPYFKVSTTLNNNPCTFKAPDGLFWNISKINAPILAFNEDDLNNEDAQNRYQLVGHFDNNGSLRVDDLAFETGDNKTALTKVYNYVNNIKNEEECTTFGCKARNYPQCENPNDNYSNCTNCKECRINGFVYDENGKMAMFTGTKNLNRCEPGSDIQNCIDYGYDACYKDGSFVTCCPKGQYYRLGRWECAEGNVEDYFRDFYQTNNHYPEDYYVYDNGTWKNPIPDNNNGSGSGLYSGSGSGYYSGSGSGFYSGSGSGSGY